MNRVDRMTGILIALQGQPRTAQQLADRFEVSRRTIIRDIDALSQLHIPISAIAGPGGGYQLPPDYSLPPIRLTSEEATIMLLALSSLGPVEDTAPGSAHRLALEKVLAVLQHDVRTQAMANLRHFSVISDIEDIDQELLAQFRAAATAGTWVQIEHVKDGTSTSRTIRPEMVYLADGRWYVRAIDALRSARRRFRVARINGSHDVAEPENATIILRIATTRDDEYGHPANPEVIVHLTSRGVELARDHPDLRNRIALTNEGGIVQFHCPESELPFYAREFLQFGIEATIQSPPELVRRVVEWLETNLEHHRNK